VYREVFDRECAQLVHEAKLSKYKAEQLQGELTEKDEIITRLRGDLLAAKQALQQSKTQCSHTQNQLDSAHETEEQLHRR